MRVGSIWENYRIFITRVAVVSEQKAQFFYKSSAFYLVLNRGCQIGYVLMNFFLITNKTGSHLKSRTG
jgi:hypothetical protein